MMSYADPTPVGPTIRPFQLDTVMELVITRVPPREWRIYPCHNLPCLRLKYIGLIKHYIGFVEAQSGLDLLVDDQFRARVANLRQTAYSRKRSHTCPIAHLW